MRTERADDAYLAVGITERDQVFTQNADSRRFAIRLGQLLGHQYRQPEATEQLPHRCSCTGTGHICDAVRPDDALDRYAVGDMYSIQRASALAQRRSEFKFIARHEDGYLSAVLGEVHRVVQCVVVRAVHHDRLADEEPSVAWRAIDDP